MALGIGKRIKEARLNKGLTQEALALLVGVTKGAIANYENGTSHPKEPVMYALIDALGVDANFLFQDCVKIKESPPYSSEAMKLAQDYDNLDIYGQRIVRLVADEEKSRCAERAKKESKMETGLVNVPVAEQVSKWTDLLKTVQVKEAEPELLSSLFENLANGEVTAQTILLEYLNNLLLESLQSNKQIREQLKVQLEELTEGLENEPVKEGESGLIIMQPEKLDNRNVIVDTVDTKVLRSGQLQGLSAGERRMRMAAERIKKSQTMPFKGQVNAQTKKKSRA